MLLSRLLYHAIKDHLLSLDCQSVVLVQDSLDDQIVLAVLAALPDREKHLQSLMFFIVHL